MQEDEDVLAGEGVATGGAGDGRSSDPGSDEGRSSPSPGAAADVEGADDLSLDDAAGPLAYGLETLQQLPLSEPRAPGLYDDDDVSAFSRAQRRVAEAHPANERPLAFWLRGGDSGYSDWPKNTRVVSLDRRQYTQEAAMQRFAELQEKQGLRVWGHPYFTVRYWCWRVYT